MTDNTLPTADMAEALEIEGWRFYRNEGSSGGFWMHPQHGAITNGGGEFAGVAMATAAAYSSATRAMLEGGAS